MNKGVISCEVAARLVNTNGQFSVLNTPPFRTSVFRQRQYLSQKKRGSISDKDAIVFSSSDSETNAHTESTTAITDITITSPPHANRLLTEEPTYVNSSIEDINHNTSHSTSNMRIPVLPVISGEITSTPKATFDKFRRKHTMTMSKSVQNNTKPKAKKA